LLHQITIIVLISDTNLHFFTSNCFHNCSSTNTDVCACCCTACLKTGSFCHLTVNLQMHFRILNKEEDSSMSGTLATTNNLDAWWLLYCICLSFLHPHITSITIANGTESALPLITILVHSVTITTAWDVIQKYLHAYKTILLKWEKLGQNYKPTRTESPNWDIW
jgi:hypothetical protein